MVKIIMVSQVSLDCELSLGPEDLGNDNGVPNVSRVSQDPSAPRMPVKKQTRQWAAWTRQEEESFFAALRQVGKNFEKITCRVQSKNKDQVRHYYYRLVRRMNKLLGPELCLDAKNSKDTNAAMLRWWSLLEKYSCKASKLHLKPRRFKIFVETLESQLLKDRKKNIRRRTMGENTSAVAQVPAPNQARASGNDNHADGQNVQKIGTGKGSLVKRQGNTAINRSNCKVEPTSGKIAKYRRKTGLAATAAYKRWEKAAIAGVSLVADAAEHLERVDTDKEIEHIQEPLGQDDSDQEPKVVPSLPEASQRMFKETSINNTTKLKLQLFPIDECTRKALEMDNRNPHLELTLSTRKKISSVLEHLNRKWGNSILLNQELLLLPFWAQRDNLAGCQKWSKDSPLCAVDVYYSIGSPSTFRLRYGWFSKAEIDSATAQTSSFANVGWQVLNTDAAAEQKAEIGNLSNLQNDQLFSAEQMSILTPSSRFAVKAAGFGGSVSNLNASAYHDGNAVVSSTRRETGASAVPRLVENTDHAVMSAGDWADSLTNISVGDLLNDAQDLDVNSADIQIPAGSNSFQQFAFSCDSFDAAIAAHIYRHQNKVDSQPGPVSHGASIWDAEETCDAFAFQKISASKNDSVDARELSAQNPSSHKQDSTEVVNLTNVNPTREDLMEDSTPVHTPENSTKDFNALTDMYWPDSLGPLDLDIPTCRYHSDDVILSDSLGGLNRLIANSLDAFQSCSFFGLDKKENPSTAEPRQTASFPDFKISSEV